LPSDASATAAQRGRQRCGPFSEVRRKRPTVHNPNTMKATLAER